MRAMILESTADIESSPLKAVELPDPTPGRGQVRVKVRSCAICRTDLHIIEGDLPEMKRPIVPGHQAVGIVDKLGPGCTRLKTGQRVGIAWLRSTCGECEYCTSGRENLCTDARFTGYHEHGGYAEYAVAPEAFVYELPESFDDVAVTPLLCAGIIGYRSLHRSNPHPGCRLLLIGFGSSAHIVIQLAKARGYEVYVVSRGEGHQELARSMGAAWVGESCADLPADMHSAIIFAPVGVLYRDALEHLKPGGTVASAGIHMSPIPELDYTKHVFNERDIRSVTCNTRADGRGLLEEAAKIHLTPHTTKYALEDANRALQDMKHDRINGTGVLVLH
ncbi:MAG: zinc-binding alcohol dehydrogenase family protein [Planctomycetes bacterium]|nr:zinc-binding alcohol dehydrogenase family protein [Planctomycetota bacterium]